MSVGTSRCVTMQVPWLWTCSIGSSMVMMWPEREWFMRSMMQVSVVDLPLPAGPVTRTMPLLTLASLRTLSGMWSCTGSGRPKGMTRMIAPKEPLWRKMFARNRPTPGSAKLKSSSWLLLRSKKLMSRPAIW